MKNGKPKLKIGKTELPDCHVNVRPTNDAHHPVILEITSSDKEPIRVLMDRAYAVRLLRILLLRRFRIGNDF